MRSLWDDGIAKAAAGLTSIEELARVVTTFQSPRILREASVTRGILRLQEAEMLLPSVAWILKLGTFGSNRRPLTGEQASAFLQGPGQIVAGVVRR